ncbi:MAG: hypothetical protein JXR05_09255 [Flavobacteriaceae bacterium]
MNFKNTLIAFFALFLLGCEVGEVNIATCGPRPVINADFYAHAIDEGQSSVLSADIQGDCLFLNVSATDICDINNVVFELLDSGSVSSTELPERNIRLVSSVERNCGASDTGILSFDIRNLRVAGNQVRINIQGYSGDIVYSY